jgi:hypothetical protein
MLTYIISGSNYYVIRTTSNTSADVILKLQNMTTQENITASLSQVSVDPYESILSFTASISDVVSGNEYRGEIWISGSQEPIWNGSFQVLTSQSIDKTSYVNQIPLPVDGLPPIKSAISNNSFIILQ